MRKLYFTAPPANATNEQKIDALIEFAISVYQSSHEIEPFEVADNFSVTNLTETRTYDADATSTAELADVLGTFILDMKNRGAKRK